MDSCGLDVSTLWRVLRPLQPVLVLGYLFKLIGNAAVAKFLRIKGPEILEQFDAMAATASMDA
jgi:hypothetical protein